MEDLTQDFLDMFTPSFASNYSIDPSVIYVHPNIAERGLLAGVLDRAYRDLDTESKHIDSSTDRKSAIAWFRSSKKRNKCSRFTFNDCINYLELGYGQIAYLLRAVQKAEDFELERLGSIERNFSCTI